MQGDRSRHCSQDIFSHEDGVKRKWVGYSLTTNSVFCIPCVLFTYHLSRGENIRPNQRNAFTIAGFSNWKKQQERIIKHEKSDAHLNAKVAQVMFLQGASIVSMIDQKCERDAGKRKSEVLENKDLLKRIIDVIIHLGKQGLAFRGQNETLSSDIFVNNGNFLETLKLLGKYGDKINEHLVV